MVHLFQWNRGRYSSDIDHALINSSMLDKILSTYFVDFPSVSDHKPLVVYCMKITTDKLFFLPKKKKNFLLSGIGINVLNLKKKEICDHNKFEILSEELGNEELSADYIVEKISLTLLIP